MEITRITNIAKQALKDNKIHFDFDSRMHRSVQNDKCAYAKYPDEGEGAAESIITV